MQHRMKNHPLTERQIHGLLDTAAVGVLATVGSDSAPYAVPVHFVLAEDKLYIHGLPRGQKLDNIAANAKVSFTVYEMMGLLLDPDGAPCNTDTRYQSVIVAGTASLVTDSAARELALRRIVQKYTPHLRDRELPANMVAGTAVIEIAMDDVTGKYQ